MMQMLGMAWGCDSGQTAYQPFILGSRCYGDSRVNTNAGHGNHVSTLIDRSISNLSSGFGLALSKEFRVPQL